MHNMVSVSTANCSHTNQYFSKLSSHKPIFSQNRKSPNPYLNKHGMPQNRLLANCYRRKSVQSQNRPRANRKSNKTVHRQNWSDPNTVRIYIQNRSSTNPVTSKLSTGKSVHLQNCSQPNRYNVKPVFLQIRSSTKMFTSKPCYRQNSSGANQIRKNNLD